MLKNLSLLNSPRGVGGDWCAISRHNKAIGDNKSVLILMCAIIFQMELLIAVDWFLRSFSLLGMLMPMLMIDSGTLMLDD